MDTKLREMFDRRGADVSVPAALPPDVRLRVRVHRIRAVAGLLALAVIVYGVLAATHPLPRTDRVPATQTPTSAGLPDPTFGDDGTVVDASALGTPVAASIQSDGKIVAAVQSFSGDRSGLLLVRYGPDGTPDASFGEHGAVTSDLLGVSAMIVQPDDGIVVAGSSGGQAFVVSRYASDGANDRGFGSEGSVVTDITPNADLAFAVALQADGKIVAAGVGGVVGMLRKDPTAIVTRYEADGSIDPTFGRDGVVSTDITPSDDRILAIAIQPDGKIVAAGTSGGYDTPFITRYRPDGALDPTFGDDGIVSGGSGYIGSLAIQRDGSIVTDVHDDGPGFTLKRYAPDGAPDATFGIGGTVTQDLHRADLGYTSVPAGALAIQGNGDILVAGGVPVGDGSDTEFVVARFGADGDLDASFGEGGTVVAVPSAGNDYAAAIVLQPDGKILVAGADETAQDPPQLRLVLARYL